MKVNKLKLRMGVLKEKPWVSVEAVLGEKLSLWQKLAIVWTAIA